ncbi:hypothetical protein [Vibrio furnissii]|uniref:hypothetical protein n=1 Tax=Vibrio furnissii TaxID=29494 RepID=UPI001EEC0419|nr:hypothetical protein [Vibrio furnissii]
MNIDTHNDLLSKFTDSSILAIKREFPFSYLYTFLFIISETSTRSLEPLMIAVLRHHIRLLEVGAALAKQLKPPMDTALTAS